MCTFLGIPPDGKRGTPGLQQVIATIESVDEPKGYKADINEKRLWHESTSFEVERQYKSY